MAGSLVFGVVNHFVIVSPDHVSHVPAEWSTLFTVTAVLLAVLEAAGTAAGVLSARQTVRGFPEHSADPASRFDRPVSPGTPNRLRHQ
jgi:hypothetical protein